MYQKTLSVHLTEFIYWGQYWWKQILKKYTWYRGFQVMSFNTLKTPVKLQRVETKAKAESEPPKDEWTVWIWISWVFVAFKVSLQSYVVVFWSFAASRLRFFSASSIGLSQPKGLQEHFHLLSKLYFQAVTTEVFRGSLTFHLLPFLLQWGIRTRSIPHPEQQL